MSAAGGAGSTDGPSGAIVGSCVARGVGSSPGAGAGFTAGCFAGGVWIDSTGRRLLPSLAALFSTGFWARTASACAGSTCGFADPVHPSGACGAAALDLSLKVFMAPASAGVIDGAAVGAAIGACVGRAAAAGAAETAAVGIGLPHGSSGTRITTVRGDRTV